MFFARIAHRIANIRFIKKFLTENRLFVRLYFNWRYKNKDPYDVTSVDYELEKYGKIVKALDVKEKHGTILEIGCGEGHLTKMYPHKADRILAVDISDMALSRARKNTAGMDNVEIRRMDIFNEPLEQAFDVVICSEVLFYFEPEQLPGVVERVVGWTKPGGYLVLVHTRALADDTSGLELKKFGAKTIHKMFIDNPVFTLLDDDVQPVYRLTLLRKDG